MITVTGLAKITVHYVNPKFIHERKKKEKTHLYAFNNTTYYDVATTGKINKEQNI